MPTAFCWRNWIVVTVPGEVDNIVRLQLLEEIRLLHQSSPHQGNFYPRHRIQQFTQTLGFAHCLRKGFSRISHKQDTEGTSFGTWCPLLELLSAKDNLSPDTKFCVKKISTIEPQPPRKMDELLIQTKIKIRRFRSQKALTY